MRNTLSFNTKFGWITATETKNKVSSIKFGKLKKRGHSSKILNKLRNSINSYFRGKTQYIKTPMLISGNSLQKKIWKELQKIKKGNTKSYGIIGKKLNISPRYVGKVCGQNKHILAIPCHRVIRSDGSLAGFSAKGGINLKRRLIQFEKDDKFKKK